MTLQEKRMVGGLFRGKTSLLVAVLGTAICVHLLEVFFFRPEDGTKSSGKCSHEKGIHNSIEPVLPENLLSSFDIPPRCSLDRIKDYTLRHNHFPNQTAWNHASKKDKDFRPGWCKFPQRIVGAEYLRACLEKQRIRKIVVMGDSNAARFTNLLRSRFACTTIKQEKAAGNASLFYPNPSYYVKDTRPVVTHQRTCRRCHSSKHVCPAYNLTVEFLSGEYVIDTEMLTVRMILKDKAAGLERLCHVGNNPAAKKFKGSLPCTDTHNSQQFLLKEYLAGDYPDLFLYFSNNHDRQIFTANEFGVYNRLLGGLFDLYLPDTTKLLWMNKLHEEVFVQPAPWSAAKYEGRWGANEQIVRMNRRLMETSMEYLMKRKNFYPYFDLQAMGSGVANDWKLDGVHKDPAWYKHLLSYIFQSVCSLD